MAYTGEKMKKTNNKQANMVLLVSPKVGVGNNCLILLMSMTSYKSGGKIELTNSYLNSRKTICCCV